LRIEEDAREFLSNSFTHPDLGVTGDDTFQENDHVPINQQSFTIAQKIKIGA
jgi:hypothetical protein